MAVDIKVPTVGESITEGTLARWLKKDGDAVRLDEPVYELETEKATTEIAAPAAGTLHISVPEGQTVAVGSSVGRIEEGAAQPVAAKPPPRRPEKESVPVRPPVVPTARPEKSEPAAGDGKQQAQAGGDNARPQPSEAVFLSPAARRLAEEAGVDTGQLAGTGRGGRITKEDVLKHLEQRPTAEAPPPAVAPPAPAPSMPPATPTAGAAPRETRERMTAIRQRIAERLVASQNTAAILTTFNEADLSAVMGLRGKYKDAFREKHGLGLGFMSFFVKAAVEALRAVPVVNARIDGSDVVYQHFYDIGVAVSTEKGLMVPVLREADRLSFAQIEQRLAEVAHKAREGKIAVNDLQGGTFTITNGGVFGSLLSTPVLNPPQSAILGMHAIQKRAVVVDDQVVIRPMMYLALSYDHRLIDGREAVLFLVRVKECIESPERLLLEI